MRTEKTRYGVWRLRVYGSQILAGEGGGGSQRHGYIGTRCTRWLPSCLDDEFIVYQAAEQLTVFSDNRNSGESEISCFHRVSAR